MILFPLFHSHSAMVCLSGPCRSFHPSHASLHSPSDLHQSHFRDMLLMFRPCQRLCQYICCLAWISTCSDGHHTVSYFLTYPMPLYVDVLGTFVELLVFFPGNLTHCVDFLTSKLHMLPRIGPCIRPPLTTVLSFPVFWITML